jgi:transposase-like protein
VKKRTWTPETKAKIVLLGLGGQSIAQICNEHQISPSMYYLWRDQFLKNSYKVFEINKTQAKELRLKEENKKLKQTIGELTLELKKNDWEE